MEASDDETLQVALENAGKKAQEVLEAALGDAASRYTVTLKVSREDGVVRLVVDVEAYRPRDPWVKYVVEEAIEAAIREFDKHYRGRRRRKVKRDN
ncbi:MAG: hypothetical protein F7C81_06970 [Desulfurococcales archaeon]|nr:hypothetical protein [Desulfurococcales archaeon]